MEDVILYLSMIAVFLFGFCIVGYFNRRLDEFRNENYYPVKKKRRL